MKEPALHQPTLSRICDTVFHNTSKWVFIKFRWDVHSWVFILVAFHILFFPILFLILPDTALIGNPSLLYAIYML